MAIHLLGIRHHGPGSCRNVLNYLQELQPDLILVEGPAEAEALLPCVENPQMTPPVALLAYQPDEPQNAVFYPFAGVLARVAGDTLCRTEPDTFPLFRLASDLFAGSSDTKDL